MADLSNASIDLFYKLRNRFPRITMGDEMSVPTIDPEKARFFNFTYVDKDSNREYGRITCSIVDGNGLKVFFDNAITDRMLPEDKDYWYRFLRGIEGMRACFTRRMMVRLRNVVVTFPTLMVNSGVDS